MSTQPASGPEDENPHVASWALPVSKLKTEDVPREAVNLNVDGRRLAGPGGVTGPGGAPLVSTGVLVIYADDVSFSFMTPEGHIFAAFITFSAHEDQNGPVAQIQVLIRANDPIYELGCRLGVVHKTEDAHWHTTLSNLAAHLGVPNAAVEQKNALVDPRVQWSEAKNVWHNAAMRTALYMPVTLIRKVFRRN